MFVSLYLLGDSLDDVQLRNLATQRFCTSLEAGDSLPSTPTYADIWASTPPGSLFRKQIIDIVVARQTCDSLAKGIAGYPPELVQELAIAAMSRAPVLTWKAATADKHKYLEPEVANDSAS